MDVLVTCIGSIVGSIAGKAAEYTVDPIAKQLSYLFKPKSKFQNLKSKVEELKDAGERVQQSVDEANRNGEEIFPGVARWLTEANEKISDEAATQPQKDEEKAMKRCVAGFCPDFKSRYQLSKKAEKQANAIAQLLERKEQFKGVSYRPALEGISTRPVKEYEAFGSRNGALNGVMAALEDDNFNIIGVYGMGGVGKTTLVKEAARQTKEKQLFDEVVFVAITQTPNTVNVQNEVAEKVGLNIYEKSMDARAARLRERLKKEKKILIILDDIWATLDLEALGIPSRDEHKGCKILMTSRNLEVLHRMNSQENLAIDILKEDEAWNLFKKMAGQIVERSDVQPIAIEVSKKCAGLPIAIATIAKALKHKQNLFEWKNALRVLRRPSEGNFKEIPADAYSAIELSYKFLEVEEHRPVFLLCSIMGHNAAIEDLLRCGSGLGLFHGVNSLEETRDKVLTLVSHLKASCLLLDGSNPEQFDMHDVVRDVAISIASRDHHWLALGRDDVFKKWSDEETMKNCNLISLQDAKCSELLDDEFDLKCPNLTFFSMGGKDYSSLKIPNNFFKGMKSLKVLVFSKMHFSSLPSSISSLKTLCSLSLLYCDLDDIVIIGELENLEILSLKGSRIAMLPKEIGQLSRLNLLDLSRCYDVEVLSPNVLSSLPRLEELHLYGSFHRWEVERHDNPRSNASLAELQHLSHLTTLEVQIPNEQAMPENDLFFAKMERYNISIGMKWFDDLYNWKETSKMLKLKMNKSIHLYDGVKKLLSKTESLYLDEVKDVMNMLSDPITEGLPRLKHLRIRNISDIKYVFDSKKLVSFKAFPPLESLSLDNLNNLEAICDGQLKAESFGQVKVIRVNGCQMVKNLFPFSIAKELRHLEEIEVFDCENMTGLFIVEKREEEIVENEVIDTLEFSQLHSLTLSDLPRFIGFCCSEKKLSSSQQRTVQPNATCLFDEKVLFPANKELTLRSIGNFENLWHDQLPAMSLGVQILTSLELYGCSKLKYVFTSSLVKSFVQLKTLVVSERDEIEEVIGGILGEEEKKVFPKLGYLRLQNLSNLKRFCSGINQIEFPHLRELDISDCCVLSTFHCDCTSFGMSSNNISMDHNFCMDVPQPRCFFNQKFTFPSLHQLSLGWNAEMKEIWNCYGQQQLLSDCFPNLKFVVLWSYPREVARLPSYLFPLLSLPNLETLEISYSAFKEIFQSEEGVGGGEKPAWVVLSQITELRLKYLDELMHLRKEKEGFQNLRILHVEWCPKLETNLVPSTVSFKNLVTLEVTGCDRIMKLVSHSTAKSLLQLREMSVYYCQRIEEIIEGGDDVQDEISFPQLNSLKLKHLLELKSFCSSRNYTFEFPSLEIVTVEDCPKMKMFSQGQSNTPMLHKVQLDGKGYEERWEGNLNSSIQQLFEERNAVAEEDESCREDQSNLSTSNTQDVLEEV